jgi:hypothetical protein
MEVLNKYTEELRRRRQRWHDHELHQEDVERTHTGARRRRYDFSASFDDLPLPLSVMQNLQTLELPTNAYPSKEQLKSAYRRLALKHHPDVIDKNNPSTTSSAIQFTNITNAYASLLKCVESRADPKDNSNESSHR